ncbi:MAG: hypothetical protein ACR2QK_17515, partial [Acidimicrobiales bacterium]
MSPSTSGNPFVGPRSLGEADALYGRAGELARLRDRLVSDRVVLLYSPSGAGKSSLIEAGLRAELRDLEFSVPPTIRFGGGEEGNGSSNRYLSAGISAIGEDSRSGDPDKTIGEHMEAAEAEA